MENIDARIRQEIAKANVGTVYNGDTQSLKEIERGIAERGLALHWINPTRAVVRRP